MRGILGTFGLLAIVTAIFMLVSRPEWVFAYDLLYAGTGVDGTSDIYLLEPNLERITNITNSPEREANFTLAEDAENIIYLDTARTFTRVMSIPMTGGEPILLDEYGLSRGENTLSPDGAWVAYTVDAGFGIEVFRQSIGGGQFESIGELPCSSFLSGFGWAPDNERLAFVIECPDEQTQQFFEALYVLDQGTPQMIYQFALEEEGRNLRWSADGEWIIFGMLRGGTTDVYRIRPDGSDLQQLTDTPDFYESHPSLSPDEAWLAFVQTPLGVGERDIYLARSDGANRQQMTSTADIAGNLIWVPVTELDWQPAWHVVGGLLLMMAAFIRRGR